jgi:hypothetical protein
MRSLAKVLALVAAAALAPAALQASALKHMNLEELTERSGRIFSGTVVEVEPGTTAVGGGTVPTVTYRVAVDATFRGTFPEKAGQKIAEVRMIADRTDTRAGRMIRFRALPPMPRLEVGSRYVLFVTKPSAAGLSATVGLGQGCFKVNGEPGGEVVANDFDNLGLFRGMDDDGGSRKRGPVAYEALARKIRALAVRK